MGTTFIFTVVTLSILGLLLAVVLFLVAKKFNVEEDPLIDVVEATMPGANCGGCGFAGCRGMADALVKRDDISELFCPVGGGDCMKAIAAYLGKAAAEKQPESQTDAEKSSPDEKPAENAETAETNDKAEDKDKEQTGEKPEEKAGESDARPEKPSGEETEKAADKQASDKEDDPSKQQAEEKPIEQEAEELIEMMEKMAP